MFSRRILNLFYKIKKFGKFYYSHRKFIISTLLAISMFVLTGSADDGTKSFYIDINSDKKTVLNNSLTILKEHFFLITDFKEKDAHITAKREADSSVTKELWYRIVGTIDHEIVLNFDISEIDKAVRLFMKPTLQHRQHGFILPLLHSPPKEAKVKEFPLKEDTPIFKEIREILSEIKNKSESK
jgi:hypothetical protein